jgi:hypothetical protein
VASLFGDRFLMGRRQKRLTFMQVFSIFDRLYNEFVKTSSNFLDMSFLTLLLQQIIPTPVGWHNFSPPGVCAERTIGGSFLNLLLYVCKQSRHSY